MTVAIDSKSQVISLDQLLELSACESDSCFTSLIEPLGYKISQENVNERSEIYTYAGAEKYQLFAVKGTSFTNVTMFSLMKNGMNRSVSFRTINGEHYHAFLGELFKFSF